MTRKEKPAQRTLLKFNSDPPRKDDDGEGIEEPKKLSNNGIDENIMDNNIRDHIASGGELTHLGGAKIFTVTEITKVVKSFLESNQNFNNIWLRGEITNFTLHRSDHMYFDLKDENSVVSCVMFKSSNQNLKFKPSHGMKVLGFGSINVYIPHGKYQFILTHMLPDGLGALHLAYLQLKEKLSKEGLFALENKKPLPRFPKTIGVITSATGAAIRDIIRISMRRFPGIRILLAPSKVQGESAVPQLIDGLKILNENGEADIIIIGRGGGSLEDLWAFNEETVARAIFNSKIPVISAVGHETDFTIADFVADARAATPSAAAELAVPDKTDVILSINQNINQIRNFLQTKLQNNRAQLNRLLQSPAFTRPKDKLNFNRINLDNLTNSLSIYITNYYNLHRSNLKNYVGKLIALNPKAILGRGYSMTLKLPSQQLITSVDQVEKNDILKIILSDGGLTCDVEEKIRIENDNNNNKKNEKEIDGGIE
jgi:exodeoxyribonuclease VII large subunit